ncbi:hypothetical protein JOF53_002852 [Crossiella equi]|uniref:Guanylate cyclase domain-containing protein n=1 Tax=Crossiella equi TaxID=130796 RepID=A0ABS5AE55_9PSEU|nr:hypothetical protein [Crossiella equi]MBP2473980.1 hypothetical protein [Crossiella equi]
MPAFRTVLGVDVIGASSLSPYHREKLPALVDKIVRDALATRNVLVSPEAWQHTGDGALISFPCEQLANVVDATQLMNELAAAHTRDSKPDVRLRLSIDIGPLPLENGLYNTNIACTRMLDAAVFKAVLATCHERQPHDFSSGLILSEAAHHLAFGDHYAELVPARDFGRIPFRHKELKAAAWIRVPGFDADTLARLGKELAEPQSSVAASAAPALAPGSVSNVAHGNFSGIQAGTISGGVNMNTRNPEN